MPAHVRDTEHSHVHSPSCGHPAVRHDGHVDYVHDGHLHHAHDDHVDECRISVTAINPSACTPTHVCSGHVQGHEHGASCGHPEVPHGDHVDYLVAGHLHHMHDGHCDDHGPLRSA
jgi:hypothetical protein